MSGRIHYSEDVVATFEFGKPRLCTIKARNSIFRSKFGFGVAAPNSRQWKGHRINYLQRNGPGFDAGLLVNDVILRVNETPAEDFGHDDLVNFLRNYEKHILKLTVVQPTQDELEPKA